MARSLRITTKHFATINDENIQLTSTEAQLLQLLQHCKPVSYDELASHVYNCDADSKTRMAMDKHIDRIRFKLRYTVASIHCVKDYGYMLILTNKKEAAKRLGRIEREG